MWILIIFLSIIIIIYLQKSITLYPLHENFHSQFQFSEHIKQFCQIDQDNVKKILTILNSEWGNNNEIYYDEKLINVNFDKFYVMIIDDKLIGFIGVDREYIKPFISHLYVTPENRRQGYASQLLAHAESYCRKMGYNYIYLWCNPELLTYYRRKNWQDAYGLISRMIGKLLLMKTL